MLLFVAISAVFDGVGELRKVFAAAEARAHDNIQTILFVDEIHRFNKAQQDALLPAVEAGIIRLIGATTEKPFIFAQFGAVKPGSDYCSGRP